MKLNLKTKIMIGVISISMVSGVSAIGYMSNMPLNTNKNSSHDTPQATNTIKMNNLDTGGNFMESSSSEDTSSTSSTVDTTPINDAVNKGVSEIQKVTSSAVSQVQAAASSAQVTQIVPKKAEPAPTPPSVKPKIAPDYGHK